jgi:HEAT repeat protein
MRTPSRAICLSFAIGALSPVMATAQVAPLNSTDAQQAVHALATWLESEEFDANELTPLIKYGQAIVPSLIAALDAGPSPSRRERARRSLAAGHERLADLARKNPDRKAPPSQAEYVKHYLSNFDARYRMRAAEALAAIGGNEARKALEAALSKATRNDLRSALQHSLKEIR